ncbi:DUF4148 domain-containing protein [Paraburkholderia xenovorans]|uniref:DUF4148 domain-containing protein n=1 Tax=Paraburkholderia xenovorans TaxID=36873 RepID=UPI0038BAED27
MSISKLLAVFVAMCVWTSVFAQNTPATGKTRAQVTQELKQARHDGIVPIGKPINYPLSARAIAQNKEIHARVQHTGEAAPRFDQHDDNVAAR